MLDVMRRHSSSIVVKVLFILLILSFALWGVGDVVKSSATDNSVMTVGDVKVSAREVQTEFNRELARLRQFFGGKLDPEEAKKFGLIELTLDRIRNRVLLELAANDLGIIVDNDSVTRAIFSAPAFQNEKGQFERRLLDQVMLANNLSEPELVSMMRRDLSRGRLTSSVGDGIAAPKVMAETLYRYRHEKRTAELMAVAPIASPALSDEAALGEFHKQNAARYTAPEYRRLSYLVLEPETLAAKVKVDEAKLEEAYQQRRDEFIVPERRKMSQLRLTNEEEAKKAQDLLKQGKSLAETAKSLGDKQLEDMGLVEKGELPAEARDAVFALSEKGTSGLIKSAFGWHIFVVEAIDNGGSKSPAEAKELIAKEMKADLAGKIVYETSTKLEDALAGGANLTEAAKRLDLVLHNIASVDATGLDAAGAKIEKMPKPDRFLKTAFTISEGAESTSIETDAGYFVLRVEKITPPVLRPLETIRDKVLADWKLEQSRKLTEKRAEEVMAALKDNADFSAVAKRFKLNVIASKPMRREGRPEDEALSSAIVTELFKLKVGETTMGETQNGFTLARLKSVIAADPASDADGMKDVTEELAQILSGDLIESFSAALAIRYGVKVNRRALGELGN